MSSSSASSGFLELNGLKTKNRSSIYNRDICIMYNNIIAVSVLGIWFAWPLHALREVICSTSTSSELNFS